MSLTIVTTRWKEELSKSKFPVVHVIPTLGREAGAYLKYIIDNYENLPEAMAFIHGNEAVQKHTRPLLEVIEGTNWAKYGFVPINNNHCPSSFSDGPWGPRLYTFFTRLFIPLKGDYIPDVNSPWIYDAGSQFVVTKERVLANPKKLYEGWYYIITTQPEFSEEFASILEKCWHVTFGESHTHMPQKDWFSFDWN